MDNIFSCMEQFHDALLGLHAAIKASQSIWNDAASQKFETMTLQEISSLHHALHKEMQEVYRVTDMARRQVK